MNPIDWLEQHRVVLGFLFFGIAGVWASNQFVPASNKSKPARWTAFIIRLIAGVCILPALFVIIQMVTGFASDMGAIMAAITTVVLVWFGLQALFLGVAAARDLTDGKPDDDARKAALWVPTLLAAGGASVFGLISHPRDSGFGLGLSAFTAAAVSAMTVMYTFKIFKAVKQAQKGEKFWPWFMLAVAILGGLIHVAFITYMDGVAATFVSPGWMATIRAVLGGIGALMILVGLADWWKDKRPDEHARRAGVIGIPLVTLFFSLFASLFNEGTRSGLELLSNSFGG